MLPAVAGASRSRRCGFERRSSVGEMPRADSRRGGSATTSRYTEFVQADFSIECGADDECLEIPWASEDGALSYRDLKRNPEFIEHLMEVQKYSELAEFLRAANSEKSAFQTAKCDVWFTTEIAPEEEIFEAAGKFGSYVDIFFDSPISRVSFAAHEAAVRKFERLLQSASEMPASVEFLVRRCLFRDCDPEQDGFYITCYVFGFGKTEVQARRYWETALLEVAELFGHKLSE